MWVPAGDWIVTLYGPAMENVSVQVAIGADTTTIREVTVRAAPGVRQLEYHIRMASGGPVPPDTIIEISSVDMDSTVFEIPASDALSKSSEVVDKIGLDVSRKYRVQLRSESGVHWMGSPAFVDGATERLLFEGQDSALVRSVRVTMGEGREGSSVPWRYLLVTDTSGDTREGSCAGGSIDVDDIYVSSATAMIVYSDGNEFDPIVLGPTELSAAVRRGDVNGIDLRPVSPPVSALVRLVDSEGVGVECIAGRASDGLSVTSDRSGIIRLGAAQLGGSLVLEHYRIGDGDETAGNRLDLRGIEAGELCEVEVVRVGAR